MSAQTEAEEVSGLPEYKTPRERHRRHLDVGSHPQITTEDTYQSVTWGIPNGYTFKDGDKLISFLENARCPVCAEKGTVGLSYYSNTEEANWSPFIRGLETSEYVGETREPNETTELLEERGWYPIVCKASTEKFFIGLASRDAAEEYIEWKNSEQKRSAFRKKVQNAREHDDPEYKYSDHTFSHGALLAAIYEELGAETYDTRELMGRSHVTKGQLQTILERIQTLEWHEPKHYHEDHWLVEQDFGIANGVQWHMPEWVDFEGLNYSDQFRTRLFD